MSAENTRIRYLETQPGVLQSRRRFITGTGREVLVELDLNAKKYRILDSVSGEEVASGGNTINKSVLKLQCKKNMVELGINFAEEKRNRNGTEIMDGTGN